MWGLAINGYSAAVPSADKSPKSWQISGEVGVASPTSIEDRLSVVNVFVYTLSGYSARQIFQFWSE